MNFFDLNESGFDVREDLKRLTILGKKSEFAVIERKDVTEDLYNSHPSEQFVYLLEGKAEIRIGDETQVVEPGQAVFIPSDVPHGIAAVTPIRYVTTYAPPRESSLKHSEEGRKGVFIGG